MQNIVQDVVSNPVAFFRFMQQNRYTVVHQSNLFFRDIEFALAKWITSKTGKKVEYFGSTEKLAQEVCAGLERTGMLKKVGGTAYILNCEEFMLPRPEPAPAKPAPAVAPAAAPAV
ncbi:MAG TPA: hypothetical protein VFA55_02700 [Candidatus Kapabacteria bacterium]|nr:hypothetical protein [Candidatus Kapabacteria bacterium]